MVSTTVITDSNLGACNKAPPRKEIIVLDFGSQYTQLIAKRIRALGVCSQVLPWDVLVQQITALNPAGIILSGGPETVTKNAAPYLRIGVLQLQIPVLGICYGMQLIADYFGACVETSTDHEFGHAKISLESPSVLFDTLNESDIDSDFQVWMSHGDKVAELPSEFECIASSQNAPIAAIQHTKESLFGVQFHPEVTHTPCGDKIFSNFLYKICGCEKSWNLEESIPQRIKSIRDMVGKEKVLLGISGGVDSAVAAALLSKAIGTQLICVLVDNGLMRTGEVQFVEQALQNLNIQLRVVDAPAIFMQRLDRIDDPEEKRRAIGATFIEVFEQEADICGGVTWLAQGTIYSDVIESAQGQSDASHLIKSHHNVGGLPRKMRLQLIEPLRDLFKDEVRQLGHALGLPPAMINRHPFPGPGLGVRMLGVLNLAGLNTLRAADAIFMEELEASGWEHKVSQAFAVLLPVKSVGVGGDARRYAPVIALRAVETVDFMTATWVRLPWDLIEKVSRRILNTVPNVSRVVYDVSSKPPATIEWE